MSNREPDGVPQVIVYCDESCHDLTARHPFMSIGSLWLPRQCKPELTKKLRRLCESRKLKGELKWRKTSAKRLADYKALVDFFFDQRNLRFRVILVKQSKVKMDQYHGRDRELAFYKFYYEMLEKWLDAGNQYLILLDYKQNRGADRYTTLRTYLERFLRGKAWIADLTVIDSRESPLAQLCDLLTGAVAAAYNAVTPGGAKEALTCYIAQRAGFATLKTSTGPGASKFNIFKIGLG